MRTVITDQGPIDCDDRRRRRRSVDQADLGHAGPARSHHHQGPRRQAARDVADVDLLVPAGRHPRRRSELHRTNDGQMPPVIHVDTDAPLYSDVDGSVITDKLWGIYYKPDFNFGGVQGGAMPYVVKADPAAGEDRSLRARFARISSSARTSPTCGARRWPSARSASKASYRNSRASRPAASAASRRTVFRCSTSSATTCYVIADSNHGYKMIGVGKLVAQEICGASDLLQPFRFSRFAEGKLHPVSNSPFPWS